MDVGAYLPISIPAFGPRYAHCRSKVDLAWLLTRLVISLWQISKVRKPEPRATRPNADATLEEMNSCLTDGSQDVSNQPGRNLVQTD